MAVSYDTVHRSSVGTRVSDALTRLGALHESFQAQGVDVLREGVMDVVQNEHMFQDYVANLSEGMDDATSANFAQLAQNTRITMLQESSLSGISPITALSLPMLRVAFPKTAFREGIPTEPVLQPKFKVTWLRPYLVDPTNGEKVFMPASIKAKRELFSLKQVAAGSSIAVGAAGLHGYDLLTPAGGNTAIGDEIDPNFTIVSVVFKALNAAGAQASAEEKTVSCQIKLDTNTNVLEGAVSAAHSDGTVNTVRVFGKVDRRGGKLDVIGLGREVVSIQVQGFISSESNSRATQVGFDVTAGDHTIGTGQPIESPINIQQMTDTMAMYNIDTTVRTLEIMSTALAQSVDLEGIDFLARNWEVSANRAQTSFDVVPPANYMLGNTQWREELKIKIDNLVTRLMQSTNITQGSVVIFGNPLDTQILHNVRWMYSGEEQVNGVNVEYKIGNYSSGVTSYKVLSSFNFAQGEMYVQFLPSQPDQMTVKYYPYSFNVIRGTTSPNRAYNPAVQMIKRHLMTEYSSMIGKVVIQNNNGL